MLPYLQTTENEEDRRKFAELYESYRELMFGVALRILRSEADAEDAVQQAFLSIFENFKKISRVHCPKTRAYVVIITEHKALDLLRGKKHIAAEEWDWACFTNAALNIVRCDY